MRNRLRLGNKVFSKRVHLFDPSGRQGWRIVVTDWWKIVYRTSNSAIGPIRRKTEENYIKRGKKPFKCSDFYQLTVLFIKYAVKKRTLFYDCLDQGFFVVNFRLEPELLGKIKYILIFLTSAEPTISLLEVHKFVFLAIYT